MPGKVQVDEILAEDPPSAPVILPLGAGVQNVLSFVGSPNIVGVITATILRGDGSQMTGLDAATTGQAISQFFLMIKR
jgi:hypothetical protein